MDVKHKVNCKNEVFSHLPSAFIACDARMFVVKEKISADDIVNAAKSILEQQLQTRPITVNSRGFAKQLVSLTLADEKSEVFCVLFLDVQHKLIRFEKLFRGTINYTTVYPREIAKRAFELNAAAIILVHNHPSGQSDPSDADIQLTEKLRSTFDVLNIEILDHLILGGNEVYSFAEHAAL